MLADIFLSFFFVLKFLKHIKHALLFLPQLQPAIVKYYYLKKLIHNF